MAQVTIGNEVHSVPVLNFASLERAWPFVEEAMTALSFMVGVRAGLSIIAAGIMERDDFDPLAFGITPEKLDPMIDKDEQTFDLLVHYFKRKLLSTEIGQIRIAVNDIMKEAGLVPEEGEGQPAGEQGTLSLSPVTSDPSLPNSSLLDVKEVAGTA